MIAVDVEKITKCTGLGLTVDFDGRGYRLLAHDDKLSSPGELSWRGVGPRLREPEMLCMLAGIVELLELATATGSGRKVKAVKKNAKAEISGQTKAGA